VSDKVRSKLTLRGERVDVSAHDAMALVVEVFVRVGCSDDIARSVAEHLTDTSLCGMESHGLMRTLQYVDQYRSGYIRADAKPLVHTTDRGTLEIDGGGGIGIPAMRLAYQEGMAAARETGLSALAVRHVGHTGRVGAFADEAAEQGFLTLCAGGGNRHLYPMVAPHGGARGMLPTNPWCIGIPGGERGPVVLDFATSKIAGGWIYAAKSAGALLPEDCLIDAHGNPTREPDDYFDGGAILPAGAQKGYALALVAELIAEAMLGPSTTECNWLLLTVSTARFREPSRMQVAAEAVLAELRDCPPAPGVERVEIPGEREREHRARSNGVVSIPEETWQQMLALHESLAGG